MTSDRSQELLRCPKCGIHEPAVNFEGLVCKECHYAKERYPAESNKTAANDSDVDNPYLLLGFWQFAILSTLMVVFFPWSLLFCWLVYGMDTTIAIVAALILDAFKTFLALLSVVAVIGVIILGLFLVFAQ